MFKNWTKCKAITIRNYWMYTQNNNSANITLKGMYYRSVRGPNFSPKIWPLASLAEEHMTAQISHSSQHKIYIWKCSLICLIKLYSFSQHWHLIPGWKGITDWITRERYKLMCDDLCSAPVSSQDPLWSPQHIPTRVDWWPPHHHQCHTASQLFALVYTVILI